MMKPVFVFVVIVLAVAMVVGCSEDETPTTPARTPKAMVVVDASPDSVSCPWQLTGPSSYSHNGQGDETLSNLTPGDYTLTWGAVAGWILPVPSNPTQTVADGGSVTFSGTYTKQVGTIIVDAEPDAINVPWQLSGPNSYNHNGQGDESLPGLTPGDYTLTWGAVAGWNLPVPSDTSQTLAVGGTVTFTGQYLLVEGTVALDLTNVDAAQTGYVRIADDPALEPQVFTIEAWITPQGPGYGITSDWYGAVLIGKPSEGTAGSWIGSWFITWSPVDETVNFSVVHQLGSLGLNIATPIGTVPVDTTVHIAATFDGANLSLYVDGTLQATDVFTWTGVYYGGEDLLIGAGNFGLSYLRRFDGVIDEVRLWDHARNVGDITANMNCRLTGNETGLLAYWGFETGGLTDDSGNGHDGVAEATGVSVEFVAPLILLSGCP